jgi:hypothetical protein
MPPKRDPSAYPRPTEFGYHLRDPEEWVKPFHAKHWGDKGGSVPTETLKVNTAPFPIVELDALPSHEYFPIIVKKEYPVILKQLVDELGTKKKVEVPPRNKDGDIEYTLADVKTIHSETLSRGICIFGHPGSGESFAQRFDRC